MKYNLSQTILQLDGSAFEDKPTLQAICLTAVTMPLKQDETLSLNQKLELYRLAQRIVATNEVDLTSEEVSLLKERVGKVFNNITIIGRVVDILESNK